MRPSASIFGYILIVLFSANVEAQKITNVKIDMTAERGSIRALNGGNLGPLCHSAMLDLTEEFMELNIPIIRTHDVPWFSMPAVDIHTIFKDFRLDPLDESNYDFRQTDDYIASLISAGADIVFRLGESIEHSANKYYVNPPVDNEKWAAICCGIIRHYNEGWANGYHYNIQYWEIWNEPDIRPACWTGTDEQFFDLFNTSAKKIKNEYPDVKVGGPAIAYTGELKGNKYVLTAFTQKFLSNCIDNAVPLDFFSWHAYGDNPWKSGHQATYVRKILDEYGFSNTESHMNEWNYIPENNWNDLMAEQGTIRKQAYSTQSGVQGAAFIANVLMLLQDEPVDVANFYATTAGLFGIFSEYGEPLKAFYALKAFSELLKTPLRIDAEYHRQEKEIVICSGMNEEHTRLNILASNFSKNKKTIHFDLINSNFTDEIKYEVYVIDATKDLEKVKESQIHHADPIQINEEIGEYTVLLIKILPADEH